MLETNASKKNDISIVLAEKRDEARKELENLLFNNYQPQRTFEEIRRAFFEADTDVYKKAKPLYETVRETRNEIFLENKGLAIYFANKIGKILLSYKIKNFSYEDIEQEAMCALLNAAWKYNPKKGGKFSAYASTAILRRLKRTLDKLFFINIPKGSKKNLKSKLIRISQELNEEDEHERLYYIAQKTNLSPEKIKFILSGKTLSLDLIMEQFSIAEPEQKGPNMLNELEKKESFNDTLEQITKMPSKLSDIIKLRFGLQTKEDVENIKNKYETKNCEIEERREYMAGEISSLLNLAKKSVENREKAAIRYLAKRLKNNNHK